MDEHGGEARVADAQRGARPRRIVLGATDEAPHADGEALRRIVDAAVAAGDLLEQLLAEREGHGLEELVARPEVVVHRPVDHAGLARDVDEGDLAAVLVAEQAHRGADELRPGADPLGLDGRAHAR